MRFKTQHMKAFTMLFIVTLSWASSFILIKIGLEELPPATFATVRFLLASMFLAPFLLLTSKIEKITCIDWIKLLVLGATGVALLNLLQFIGLTLTTAINGSILLNTNPIFISILSVIFLNEKIKLKNMIGIVMAFIGVVFIITREYLHLAVFSQTSLLGDILILGSAICWAIYTIVGKTMFSSYKPIVITTFSILIGTVFLLIYTLTIEDITIVVKVSIATWIAILFLALVCSGLAYILWYEALSILEASEAGVFLFTMPIYTILIANLTLKESITIPAIIGIVLVILGLYLTEKHS